MKNKREIFNYKKPFLIAEVGINHNGSLALAKKTILKAKKCGASAVKIQTFKTESFCQNSSKYYSLFKSVELNAKQVSNLYKFAKQNNILLFSSVFDEWSTDLNYKNKAQLLKIASGDITNLPLIEHASKKKLPMIISTGGSTIKEIEEAVKTVYLINKKIKIALLHCVSKYPAEANECNLKSMKAIKEKFKLPVGFSDHTIGIETSISAVALGAEIIEKHFTLDKNLPGPDHKLSSDPNEFKKLSLALKTAYLSIGNEKKKVVEEKENVKQLRRSLFAAVNIKKNTVIKKSMIVIARPEKGLKPKYLKLILGKKAKRAISKGLPLQKSMFIF